MKKHLLLLFSVLVFSCSTSDPLSREDIINLESIYFEPFKLNLAHDLGQFRIDVFRQTYEESDECGTTTENEPYHAMGFDIGNALFLDLHGNLSFRIDQLIGGSDQNDDQIFQVIYEDGNDRYWQLSSKGVCQGALKNGRLRRLRCRDLQTIRDTMEVKEGRNSYRLVKSRAGISYYLGSRKRSQFSIRENIYGNYRATRGRWRVDFLKDQSRLHLGNWFIIEQSPEQQEITVYTKERKGPKFCLRIRRSDHSILVYDDDFKGIKIELEDDGLVYFEGKDQKLEVRKSRDAKSLFEQKHLQQSLWVH